MPDDDPFSDLPYPREMIFTWRGKWSDFETTYRQIYADYSDAGFEWSWCGEAGRQDEYDDANDDYKDAYDALSNVLSEPHRPTYSRDNFDYDDDVDAVMLYVTGGMDDIDGNIGDKPQGVTQAEWNELIKDYYDTMNEMRVQCDYNVASFVPVLIVLMMLSKEFGLGNGGHGGNVRP